MNDCGHVRSAQDLPLVETLAHERHEVMNRYLEAIAGLDHDEIPSPDVERLHNEVTMMTIRHETALANPRRPRRRV